ncbi:hypothetical protein AB1282_00330 [Gottfriedia sp. S16(2024)]|uniref:hypothetical protein n=1 Tax=Gottfriedia sp. S16(2024) TaxID=3162883 RepID=UPI003D212239
MANIKRTKEDCIRELKELAAQGHPLTSTTVDMSLRRSCQSYFGKWSVALKELGLKSTRKPYEHTETRRLKLLERTVWTDEIIIEKLTEALENRYTSMEIRNKYVGLGDSLDRRFGGIHNACKHFGLPSIERDGADIYKHSGWKFEDILGELFNELDIKYEKYKHDKYRPDFVVGKRWFDAKLSEWTINTCNTIENYEPLCSSLTIVYLRGREHDRMLTNKTRMVHVNKYVKQLPRDKRGYFYAKFNDILTKLNEAEAV